MPRKRGKRFLVSQEGKAEKQIQGKSFRIDNL